MKLPPPVKWNKQTDDIDSVDFLRHAQDQERSLLPANTVFPRTGQIWEAVRDCEVHVRKWIMGPKMPVVWIDARLRQGERVRVLDLDDPKPLEVRFEPLRSLELRESIAPDSVRYELWLRTTRTLLPAGGEVGYFNELFKPVDDRI